MGKAALDRAEALSLEVAPALVLEQGDERRARRAELLERGDLPQRLLEADELAPVVALPFGRQAVPPRALLALRPPRLPGLRELADHRAVLRDPELQEQLPLELGPILQVD